MVRNTSYKSCDGTLCGDKRTALKAIGSSIVKEVNSNLQIPLLDPIIKMQLCDKIILRKEDFINAIDNQHELDKDLSYDFINRIVFDEDYNNYIKSHPDRQLSTSEKLKVFDFILESENLKDILSFEIEEKHMFVTFDSENFSNIADATKYERESFKSFAIQNFNSFNDKNLNAISENQILRNIYNKSNDFAEVLSLDKKAYVNEDDYSEIYRTYDDKLFLSEKEADKYLDDTKKEALISLLDMPELDSDFYERLIRCNELKDFLNNNDIGCIVPANKELVDIFNSSEYNQLKKDGVNYENSLSYKEIMLDDEENLFYKTIQDDILKGEDRGLTMNASASIANDYSSEGILYSRRIVSSDFNNLLPSELRESIDKYNNLDMDSLNSYVNERESEIAIDGLKQT